MKKINFKDGQEPAIDEENLNQMQDNIEEAVNEASQTGGILTGTIVDYDGETVPEGYEEVEDDEADGILTGSVIGFKGDTIPEGYEEVNNPNVYSTEEKVIGEWIDGKPLYRKVIQTTMGVAVEFTSEQVGMAMLEKGYLFVDAGTDKFHFPINFSRPDREVYVSIKNNTATPITNFEDWKTVPVTLIINYTKTTD